MQMFSRPWVMVVNIATVHDKVISFKLRHNDSLTIVYSTVYPGVDQRKHQSSAALVFVCECKFPAHNASNAENVSIWWCHHVQIGLHSYGISLI